MSGFGGGLGDLAGFYFKMREQAIREAATMGRDPAGLPYSQAPNLRPGRFAPVSFGDPIINSPIERPFFLPPIPPSIYEQLQAERRKEVTPYTDPKYSVTRASILLPLHTPSWEKTSTKGSSSR